MVRALHEAGIEVILDVVYNHTAEGNHLGPVLSMKGIDNAAYYRLVADDRRFYYDTTGTGNSLNVRHPHTLQLIMDSLRYWVTEMHVDGFRFDLAASLARQFHEVDRLSAFFDLIQQDPVVSQVKLIAEPWDIGEGGYQVGNFPALWSEWNGRYRDTVRDFWRGEPATLGEFASRLTGSSDLYQADSRHPGASVNFVTAHDGFTLRDLVSYNEKHNEANGEDNGDGESRNRSWNCGAEGDTNDPGVVRYGGASSAISSPPCAVPGGPDAARRRRVRPHPGRQQQCLLPGQRDLLARLGPARRGPAQLHPPPITLRRDILLRRRRYLLAVPSRLRRPRLVQARRAEMNDDDGRWVRRSVGLFHNGEAIADRDERGQQVMDDLPAAVQRRRRADQLEAAQALGTVLGPVLDTAGPDPDEHCRKRRHASSCRALRRHAPTPRQAT